MQGGVPHLSQEVLVLGEELSDLGSYFSQQPLSAGTQSFKEIVGNRIA